MDERIADRYRPLERIGSGGMADVWRARDERVGRDVAVKRMHPHLLRDAAARERFQREVAAASSVTHPLALRILDAGLEDDAAFLVMEYLPGGTLAERLERGPLGTEKAAAVGADVAVVLAAIHAAGIVHRDVTTSNILFDAEGRARLGDFGIARPIDATDGDVTAVGNIAGTLRFVAPEVLAGSVPTPASDVWSLGAVLYEAISGRPPFDASSPAALLAAHHHPAPELPHDRDGTGDVVAAMLADRPVDRPTAAQAAVALRGARESGPDDRTVVMAAPVTEWPPDWQADAARTLPPGRSRTARPAALGVVVAALALVIALAAAATFPTGQDHGSGAALLGESGVSASAAPTPSAAPTATPQAKAPGSGSSHKGDHGKGKGKRGG